MNADQKLKIRNNLFGIIQLIAIVVFVVGALTISITLKYSKAPELERSSEDRLLFVETKDVKPSSYQIKFNATGTVDARNNINIISQVSGLVVSVNENFYTGNSFTKDTHLFQIEPKDFELEVDRLSALVAQAQTKYNLEKAESDIAVSEWQQLHPDKKAPRLVARKPQLNEAWRNLKGAKAQLEKAELNLTRASFTLPFDGKVSSSSIDVGQYVVAGQSYGEIYNTQNLEVVSSLKDNEIEWLLSTTDPEINIQLENGNNVKGYLKRSAAKLDSLTRFATIAIGFKDIPKNIIPGMFVNLEIEGPTLEDVRVLPSSVIQKGNIIWQIDDKNILSELEYKILYSDNDIIVIKSEQSDLKVVTSKLSGASAGQTVQTKGAEDE